MNEIIRDLEQESYPRISRRDAFNALLVLTGAAFMGRQAFKHLSSQPETTENISFDEETLTSSSTGGFNSNELENIQPQPTKEQESITTKNIIEGHSIHNGVIELSNPNYPTKWVFALNSGTSITSKLAYPHAYQSGSQVESIFNPWDPNLVTYLEDNGSPMVWGHSSFHNGKKLTMTDLGLAADFPQDIGLNSEPGNTFLRQEIIGSKVYLFQAEDENKFKAGFPSNLSHPSEFEGNYTEAEIIAAIRIPRFFTDYDGKLALDNNEGRAIDLISQVYDKHILDVWTWLKDFYPNYGFSNLNPNEVIGLKICSFRHEHEIHPGNVPISQRPNTDVKYDQLQSAVYGRYIFAMRPTDNFNKKIDIPSLA